MSACDEGDSAWSHERLDAALKSAVDQAIRLRQPLPVYFLYWTAWADPDGAVSFRADVYGRDAVLIRAMAIASRTSPDVSRINR